ncbi:hypothetical protein [Gloeomargarita sp.]
MATRFKPQGEIPPGARIAKRPLTVKVLEELDTVIRALPEPSAWLRRVITEAAKRELLEQPPGTASENSPPPAPPGSPPPVDKSEVIDLLDTALTMTKVKDIKPLLEKIRGLLT